MATVADCLHRANELLEISDSARLDTEVLLAKALEKPRTFLYTWNTCALTQQQFDLFSRWFEQRLNGEPIAYIIGEKEFWSLPLRVSRATLIPRPETELLVETALSILPATAQHVLDLGTGTGAIALALASERAQWQIEAVDHCAAAVELAIDNCRALQLTKVNINRSDWYTNVRGREFDAIVCNPPYIDPDDTHLQQGDVRFEPQSALVAAQNGLADLYTVISGAPDYLKSNGWILLEHGCAQGDAVRDFLSSKLFINICTHKDLAGHERMTMAQFQEN